MKVRLGDYVNIKTGKLDANAADTNGIFPFFTCSVEPLKINIYAYECECVLVAGNGDLNVKYFNGKFNAYQRTYIIESKNKDILTVPYLYYFLDKYVEILRGQAIGGVIKYIKLANLTEAQIELPPADIQKNIVDEIKKIDSLIEGRKQQLERLDLLVKSQFIEMFGSYSIGWKYDTTKLGELGKIKSGGTPDRKRVEQYRGDIPWITTISLGKTRINREDAVDFISEKAIEESATHLIPENSVMLGIRVGVGKTSVNDEPMCTNQDIVSIYEICEKTKPFFIKYVLNEYSNLFEENKRGATIKGVTSTFVKNLDIPVPEINIQNRFIEFIEQTDKSKATIKRSLEKLETLKKALMQKYFG